MCKILNGVLLFTIYIYESRNRLVVFGVMGYCTFTLQVGVRLCCCSVGVGVLPNDLAR